MSKFLIDYENVYIEGLDGLENLTEQDIVYIFYTVNRCGMTFDLHKRLMKSRAAIKLLEVSSAPPKNPFSKSSISNSMKNALDLQLTLYLGYLMASCKDEKEEIFIISKDNDFGLDVEFCSSYLENCSAEVMLFHTIQAALDKDLPPEEPEIPEASEATEDDEFNSSEQDRNISEEDYGEKFSRLRRYSDEDEYSEYDSQENEKMFLAAKANTTLAVGTEVSSTLFNAMYNLFENNGIRYTNSEFVEEVCRMVKKSGDLLDLNNNLAALLRNGEKVKEIYHVIKPQFSLLKNF